VHSTIRTDLKRFTAKWILMAIIGFLFCLCLQELHAQVAVENPSKQGPQQESIYRTLDFINANMDAQCTATLPMAKEMIVALEGRTGDKTVAVIDPNMILIGHGDFPHSMIAAFTGATAQTVGYLIIVANAGAFYTEVVPAEFKKNDGNYLAIAHQYHGGTNQAKAVILLHELGHATNAPGFLSDLGSQAKIDHNDAIILRGCKSVIKAAGKYRGAL
jgi:hypothetical protein